MADVSHSLHLFCLSFVNKYSGVFHVLKNFDGFFHTGVLSLFLWTRSALPADIVLLPPHNDAAQLGTKP